MHAIKIIVLAGLRCAEFFLSVAIGPPCKYMHVLQTLMEYSSIKSIYMYILMSAASLLMLQLSCVRVRAISWLGQGKGGVRKTFFLFLSMELTPLSE